MSKVNLALAVCVTAGAFFQILTWAAIARLLRESGESTQAIVTGHNQVAQRVSELADFALTTASVLALPSRKSTEDGDAR